MRVLVCVDVSFFAAIDAAGGTKTDAGAALQNGKIKNKVLKLTAKTQVLKIKVGCFSYFVSVLLLTGIT